MGIKDYLIKIKRAKEVKDWLKRGKTPPTPQMIKQFVVRSYGETYKIDTLIETGTYTGDMIEAVKPYFKEIYSIELSEILWEKCKKRFCNSKHKVTYQKFLNKEGEKIFKSGNFVNLKEYNGEMGTFKGLNQKGFANINLFCGDSAKVLLKILLISESDIIKTETKWEGDINKDTKQLINRMQYPLIKKNLANSAGSGHREIAIDEFHPLRKLFWLDAHYSGGEQTPIVKEIDIVLKDNPKHIILIDDARLFDGTNDYPTLDTIKNYVSTLGKTMKVEDDIIRIT